MEENRCRTGQCGKKGCHPAEYNCGMFDLQVDPFDPTKWKFVIHGMTYTVDSPRLNETDTSISTNFSNATLNYKAEKHSDIITGAQIGDIIKLSDLRDVDFDPSAVGTCFELIYRKFQNCGEGCESAADQWKGFNVNNDGAKSNGIQYVRGANIYGCPNYLNVPTNQNQYWWGMWRPTDTGTGTQFGYVQPQTVSSLPTDSSGNVLVLSQQSNGKPVFGPISMNLTIGAQEFTCRQASPNAPSYFTDNSTTVQEFNVTPDNDLNWRAPTDGIMWVTYCVNPYAQAPGNAEVDVTCMLDNETWSSDLESKDSTHSTWQLTASSSSVSESATACRILPKGRTIKLHARNTGDDGVGMSGRSGRWRVHAVKAVFLPLTLQ